MRMGEMGRGCRRKWGEFLFLGTAADWGVENGNRERKTKKEEDREEEDREEEDWEEEDWGVEVSRAEAPRRKGTVFVPYSEILCENC